ncbi:DUF3916 domain-containing protein [Pseudomonas sp. RP23018S]|uniref:DUF3916 domain-containing protein n=1 Tax=Pseudomonas sp. RP23018S TaxID=3096037 RepID=UPI002ACA0F76|nr:DUF3916 domain-containing protein [Pseudomonas sp. RP23018S]MDZ5602967.1 DUF3916 domain-containing protein [Pseudomonas sp. RP23018S]
MSRAAHHSAGYYRVACRIIWPWIFQNEVTIFYDRDYYLRLLGDSHPLETDLLSKKLGLHLPANVIEHGHDVTGPDDEGSVQWWYLGEPA